MVDQICADPILILIPGTTCMTMPTWQSLWEFTRFIQWMFNSTKQLLTHRPSQVTCTAGWYLLQCEAARAMNTQQTWRQEFLGSRSSTVERSSTRTAAAGTFLRFFQTIFENTPVWQLKRLVTLSTYRCYINKCIYLSIYLHLPLMVPYHQHIEKMCLATSGKKDV